MKYLFSLLVLLFSLNLMAQIPSYVPTNGLVGYWPFNGNAIDESGNGNDGNVLGANLTTDENGNANSAYNFNYTGMQWNAGLHQTINIPYNSSFNSNTISVSIWFYARSYFFPGIPGNDKVSRLVTRFQDGYNNPNGQTWGLELSNNQLSAFVLQASSANNQNSVVSSTNISLNEWHHVTFTFDNISLKLYLNGILVSETQKPPTFSLNTNGSSGLSVGCSNQANGYWYESDAKIDKLGFWNRALTQQEITNLNSSSVPPPTCNITISDSTLCLGESTTLTSTAPSSTNASFCASSSLPSNLQTGLVGYWPFCGNANDASGNGNNGIVNGATLTTDRFGNANSAYNFDGVNDKIFAANSSSLNPNQIAVSVWINPTEFGPSEQYIINKSIDLLPGSVNRSWAIRLSVSGQLTLEIRVNSTYYIYQSTSTLTLNQWNNIVFTYDGGVAKLFNNNINIINQILPGTLSNFNYDLSFGYFPHSNMPPYGYFLNGKLDDIGIWNRALSTSEIQQLYTQGQTTYTWSPGNATTPSITVSPTTTTTYTCTTTVNGVSCSDAITVTVDSLNLALPATTNVCGTTATLSAPAGATSYLWNTNATTASIAPTTSGLYACTVTKGACVKSDTTQLYLVNSTITTIDSTLCLGESTTLNVASTIPAINCTSLPGTLSNGLVGYWPFCGNANDASGNGNNGLVNGATLTTDRFGNANNAYDFNGVNSNIIIPHSEIYNFNTTDSYSISLWAKADEINNINDYYIFQKWNNSTEPYPYAIRMDYNRIRAWRYLSGNSPFDSLEVNGGEYVSPIDVNKFYNITVLYKSDSLSLYIDGNLVAKKKNYLPGTITKNTSNISIGSSLMNSWFFNGKIDDIGIWNRTLSTSEIQQLYTQGQTTYTWSPGNATTPSITVSPTTTTTYTCTTTVNGVSCSDAITVTVDSLNLALPATTNVCGTSATLSAPAGATSYLWNTNATTASIAPTTSGVYSVTATKGACVKSAATQLNLLNPVVSSPDSILCIGDSTSLTSISTISPASICSGAALPTNLQTGLVGYWPFCGNANDASGNGNNGTVNGATLTTDRFGNSSSAYSFDGNDWISATRAHQAVFTTSVWVQSTNGNCNKPILDANNKSWELYSDCANGQLNFIIWNGGVSTNYPTNIVLGTNTWYHVVAAYSNSQIKIYVNGSLITTQVATAIPAISGVLNMGVTNSDSLHYFTGKLDDIGIWNRTLTLAEIQQLYTQGETTYSWSPGGETSQTIYVSPTQTTTYTCTTTVNGASCSDSIVVTVNPLPTVNAGADTSICLNQPVTLSGSGAVTYSWNNSVVNNTPFTPTATATYTVTGTDANGCVNTDNVVVTIKPLPTVNAGLDQSICIGNPAIFNATGAFSYSWSNGVANQVAFFPDSTNTYVVTGISVNGCLKKDTLLISVNSLPIVTAGADTSICFGQSVTLSGSGAVSYTWNNGIINNTPFTPSATANYIVTGTNANACQGSDTVVVTILALPSINAGIDKTICIGDSVALTASGSPLISWNNGIFNGIDFSPDTTTIYTVTGTGANGCINTDQAIVYVNALPPVYAGSDTAVCNGSYITLSGSGAVSYSWNNSVTNSVPFIPSSTNTYTVIGTDVNGCISSDQILVTINTLPPVDAGNYSEICIGDSIQLSASGASTYVWDNGVVDSTAFYPTSSITYTVVGTNANGCSNSDTVTVTVNLLPTVFAGIDTLVCEQSSYTLSGSGATTYTWDNGVTNNVPFTVSSTTTYSVTGTDSNGCQNSDQVTINMEPLPILDSLLDQAVCLGDSVSLTATGNVTSYSWSNGLINGDYFIPTATMVLTVTATNTYGCVKTDQVNVVVNPLPTVDAGPDRIICKGQAVALNAVSNGSIVWGGGVVNNLPFNPSTTATYGVTATSAAGCVNTDDITVTVGDYPFANFYTETPTQYSPNSTFDFVNLTTGASSYEWDFGDLIGTSTAENPSYTYQPLVTASYFVTLVASSPLGCKDSITSLVQLINNSPGLDVIIPTGFSPNNDSDNDDWTIYGIENYPNSKILVFNRWGLKVFEGNEFFPTWNGVYGGVILPTADYYYIVELSDGRKFNGVVTLKQ